jgi:GxxExxY protein
MTENELTSKIIEAAIKVHTALGPGLLESVYEEVLYYELTKMGFFVERQKALPVFYDDKKMDVGFRSDLIVEKRVLLELKSIEEFAPIHFKTTLNYLKLTNIHIVLLINFNVAYLKDGIKRIVNGYV